MSNSNRSSSLRYWIFCLCVGGFAVGYAWNLAGEAFPNFKVQDSHFIMSSLIDVCQFLIQFLVQWQSLGLFAVGGVLAIDRLRKGKPGNLWALIGLLSSLPLVAWGALRWLAASMGLSSLSVDALHEWMVAVVLGLLLGWLWLRYAVAWFGDLGAWWTRPSSRERNRRTDVRTVHEDLPNPGKPFDPLRWIKLGSGLFVGLDEHKKPIYISALDWCVSHVLVKGRTRIGKGVAVQVLLFQAILRGEFVCVLDPKGDEWAPHVLHEAATRAGQPYRYIDLRPSQPPQFNLFKSASAEMIEAMLNGGLSLTEKGDAADFYRLADRRAAREAAHFLANGDKTAADALAELGAHWLEVAPGFHAAMEEIADLPAVNAKGGLGLAELVAQRGCLYVTGDMSLTRVIRVQRMVTVGLMMVARDTQADYQAQKRPLMTLFADEFKVHISRPFMTSLAAAAGWGLHCILAFQSLQDLEDVPVDLNKDMVHGAVVENCTLDISYQIKDADTADELARATGEILVDDETRKVTRNAALAETIDADRTISQRPSNLIDRNKIMNLPRGVAVVMGVRPLATLCHISPIRVKKRQAACAIIALPSMPRIAHAAVVSKEGLGSTALLGNGEDFL